MFMKTSLAQHDYLLYLVSLASLALKACSLLPRIKCIFTAWQFIVLSDCNGTGSPGSSESGVSNIVDQPSSWCCWIKWALRKADTLLSVNISEAFVLKENSVTLSRFWWTSCQWSVWIGEIGIRPVYSVIKDLHGLVYGSFTEGMIEWMNVTFFSSWWMLVFQLTCTLPSCFQVSKKEWCLNRKREGWLSRQGRACYKLGGLLSTPSVGKRRAAYKEDGLC